MKIKLLILIVFFLILFATPIFSLIYYNTDSTTNCAYFSGTDPACPSFNHICTAGYTLSAWPECPDMSPTVTCTAGYCNICGDCHGGGVNSCDVVVCGTHGSCTGGNVCNGLGKGASYCVAPAGAGSTCYCDAMCTSPNTCVSNICTASNTPPVVSARVISPTSPVYATDDVTINVTCYDVDAGNTITAYWNVYKNNANMGLSDSKTVTNNTNTLLITVNKGNFSGGDTVIGEIWCGDGTDNTTKGNTSTATYQRKSPTLSLSASGGWTITYGSTAGVTGSESNTGDSDCTYTLYRNTTPYNLGSGSSVTDNTVLAAGGYLYTYNNSQCTNYTSGTTSNTLTVNKASPSLSCSGTSNTYPTSISFSGSGCPAQISCTLTNPTPAGCPSCSGSSCNILCIAGVQYSSTYTTSGNANYSSATSSSCYATENKGSTTATLYLNGSTSSQTSVYPNSTVNATATSSVSGLYVRIWRNNSLIANTTSSSTNISQWGAWNNNFTAKVLGNQNYSDSANVMLWWNVSKGSTNTSLYLNGTEGNKSYNIGNTANFTVNLNISGKTVKLASNYTGWVLQSSTTPLMNYTTLNSVGDWYNLTGYFEGDENYSASTRTYFFNVTTLAPAITIDSPSNISYSTTAIWANVTLDKTGSWCGRSLDSGGNVTMSNDSTTHFYNQTTSLGEGGHSITFYCNGTDGSMSTGSTRYFTVDLTPPTYSSNATNDTTAGKPVKFSLQWNDSIALHNTGQYQAWLDNCTGSFVNVTPLTNFTSTPQWANFTVVINNTVGCTIKWFENASDNVSNWNNSLSASNYFSFTTISEYPQYSLNSTNSTVAGTPISHNLYWTDNYGLSGYIFSFINGTNGTTTYNFSDTTNNKAYNNSIATNPPTSLSPAGEQEFSSGAYTNISTSDNNYFETNSTTHSYHKFNMTINESVNSITQINVSWKGHTTTSGTANLYVYNFTLGNWSSSLASNTGATDFWLNKSFASGFSDLINSGRISVLVQDPSNWADSNCNYRRLLSFTKPFGTENLTNFPVLVLLNSSRINYTSTNATDIRFYDADNTSLLYKETELWNTSGNSYIWVKANVSNTTTGFIWAYYNCSNSNSDDATNVWDINYTGVWHLHYTNSSNYTMDSTPNDNDGKLINFNNNPPLNTTGKIDNAFAFDGSNDHINVSDSNTLEPNNITFGIWIYPLSWTHTPTAVSLITKRSAGTNGYFIFWFATTTTINFDWGGSSYRWDTTYNPPLNTWTYLVLARNGTHRMLYVNGSLYSSTTTPGDSSLIPTTANLRIGYDTSVSQYPFNGTIDDVQISNFSRSASWINASYLSGSDSLITYGQEEVQSGWVDSSCNYRRLLTFSKPFGTQNLVNFPVLIVLNSTRIDYTSTNQTDIRFYDENYTTLLYKETELWNTSGNSFVWIKVPQVNNNTQDYIWAYYNCSNSNSDNKTQVWDSNYKGVWHLHYTNSTNYTMDSTSNGNNGKLTNFNNNPPLNATGEIDNAFAFDGSNDYVNCGGSSTLNLTSLATVSLWVKVNNFPAYTAVLTKTGSVAWDKYIGVVFNSTAARVFVNAWDTNYAVKTGLSTGTWYNVVGTYNETAGTIRIFVNGVEGVSDTYSSDITTDASNLLFGITGDTTSYPFNGTMDEVRISNTSRSLSWINASYLTELDNFITYGSEEAQAVESKVSTDFIEVKVTSGWVNDTWTNNAGLFTGTSAWSNVTKVVNSNQGKTIYWKVYVNDTSNNWNVSQEYSYLTTSAAQSYSQNLSQSILASLLTSRIGSSIKSVTTSLVTSLAFSRISNLYKSLSSFLTANQAFSRISTLYKYLTSFSILSQSMSRLSTVYRSISSSFTSNAIVSRIGTLFKSISSSMSVSQSMTRFGLLYRSITSYFALNKSLSRLSTLIRLPTSSFLFSQSLSRSRSIINSITQSLTIPQSIAKLLSSLRSITSSITFSQSLLRIATLYKSITSSFAINQSISRIAGFFRFLLQLFGLTATPTSAPSTYNLAITDPTTSNPMIVTSDENITIAFNFTNLTGQPIVNTSACPGTGCNVNVTNITFYNSTWSGNCSIIDPDSWWNSNWSYRKQHNITNATGADVNYTINITVINGTSVDSDNTVYINNKMRSDFGDIRFTNSTDSLLNYWMESVNSGVNATFWIQISDNITSANKTIYVYYGNNGATNISNGTNTFIYFDDFSSGNLNLWTNMTGSLCSFNATNNRLNIQATTVAGRCGIYFTGSSTSNASVDFKTNMVKGSSTDQCSGTNFRSNGQISAGGTFQRWYWYTGSSRWEIKSDTVFYNNSVATPNPEGTTGVLSGRTYGNTYYGYWNDQLIAMNSSTYAGTNPGKVGVSVYTNGSTSNCFNQWVDDFRTRAYVNPEPAHSAWGSEESYSAGKGYFIIWYNSTDSLWRVNCTTPNAISGSYNLYLQANYTTNNVLRDNTQTNAVSYGGINIVSITANFLMSQSLQRMSNIYKALTSSFSISQSLSRLGKLFRLITSSFTFSQLLSRLATLLRLPTSSFTISQSLSRIPTRIKSILQSLTISQSITRLSILYKSITSSFAVTVTSSRIYSSLRSITGYMTISQSISRMSSLFRTINTSITSNAITGRILYSFKSLSNSFTVSQTIIRTLSSLRSISSYFSISQTTSRMLSSFKSLTSYFTFTQSLSRISSLLKTVASSLTISQVSSRLSSVFRSITSYFTYAQSLSRLSSVYRSITSYLTISQLSSRISTLYKSITSYFALNQSLSRLSTLLRLPTSSFLFSQSASRIGSLYKSLTSYFTVSQLSSRLSSVYKSITGYFTFANSLTRISEFYKSLSSSFTSNAVISRIGTFYKSLAGYFNLSQSLTRLSSFLRFLLQLFGLTATPTSAPSTYNLAITDPTTSNPMIVTSNENITIAFNFTNLTGQSITSGVNITNITIGSNGCTVTNSPSYNVTDSLWRVNCTVPTGSGVQDLYLQANATNENILRDSIQSYAIEYSGFRSVIIRLGLTLSQSMQRLASMSTSITSFMSINLISSRIYSSFRSITGYFTLNQAYSGFLSLTRTFSTGVSVSGMISRVQLITYVFLQPFSSIARALGSKPGNINQIITTLSLTVSNSVQRTVTFTRTFPEIISINTVLSRTLSLIRMFSAFFGFGGTTYGIRPFICSLQTTESNCAFAGGCYWCIGTCQASTCTQPSLPSGGGGGGGGFVPPTTNVTPEIKTVLDTSVDIQNPEINAGDRIYAKISLIKVEGPKGVVNVNLTYWIKDSLGNIIGTKQTVVGIENIRSDVYFFILPISSSPGAYTFEVLAQYNHATDQSSDIFNIVVKPIKQSIIIKRVDVPFILVDENTTVKVILENQEDRKIDFNITLILPYTFDPQNITRNLSLEPLQEDVIDFSFIPHESGSFLGFIKIEYGDRKYVSDFAIEVYATERFINYLIRNYWWLVDIILLILVIVFIYLTKDKFKKKRKEKYVYKFEDMFK
jgi:hypothetical protein